MGALNDFLNIILNVISPFLSRKRLKKYLNGILEPDMEELEIIKLYIERTRPEMMANGASNILRQIEQMKIPYFRDLTVEELDFLLDKEVSLHGILDVVMAKGGLSRGLAAIVWNENRKRYEERKKIIGEELIIFFFIALIPVTVYGAYIVIIRLELGNGSLPAASIFPMLSVFFIFYLFYLIFILFPLASIPSNINTAKKRLLRSSNRVIFGNN